MITTETISADAYGIAQADEPPPRRSVSRLPVRRKPNQSVSLRSRERPKLPKRPLTARFFVPFGFLDTWMPLIVFVATGLLGLLMLQLPLYLMGPFGGVVSIIFLPFVVIVDIIVLGYFMFFAMYLYDFTSSGMDEGEFESEFIPFDYFVNGFWLLTFSVIAATPGWFLGTFLFHTLEIITDSSVSTPLIVVMMRISHWFFFPIFFLSSMEAGSMFALFAKNTIVSLYRQPFAWFRFYLLTGVLFVLFDICLLLVAASFGATEVMIFVGIALFFFLFAIQTLFFFRLLGRLAWLIEETDRQARELDEERMMA
jgi:hypothetical protein